MLLKQNQLRKVNKLTIIYALLILVSCTPPKNKNDKTQKDPKNYNSDYLLNLVKVDNLAKVYIDDSLVYTSSVVHGNPEIDYYFDFSSFVNDGSEILKVELYNGEAPYHIQDDQHWEIRYYLIINGENVDFIHESGDDYRIGKVYEETFFMEEFIESR